MNFLFWKLTPQRFDVSANQPAANGTSQPSRDAAEPVVIQYFDSWKFPAQKTVTPEKYAELLHLAETLKGNYSIALNNHLEEL